MSRFPSALLDSLYTDIDTLEDYRFSTALILSHMLSQCIRTRIPTSLSAQTTRATFRTGVTNSRFKTTSLRLATSRRVPSSALTVRQFATEAWEGIPTTNSTTETGAFSKLSSRSASSSASGAGRSPASYSTTSNTDEPPTQDYEEWTTSEESRTMSMLAPFWTLMFVGGMASMAFALGKMSDSAPVWPPELRTDLRVAFRETMKGSREASAYHFYRAWEKAKDLPLEKFGPNPLLTLSSMGIALASTYDQTGKHLQAFEVYSETLDRFLDTSSAKPVFEAKLLEGLSTAERLRAVAIAYKMSEMAHEHHMDGGEEKWLQWCVKTLKDVFGMGLEPGVHEGEVSLGNVLKSKELRAELRRGVELANWMPPMWRLTADIARPFEALAKLYSREGRFDQAMPLYFQAIDILMPGGDSAHAAPAQAQCRAAQLMGNVSEGLLRSRGNDRAALSEAESWANKGLDIAARNHRGGGRELAECERAYAFMLYNLAMIRELSGDQKSALGLFAESLGQAKAIGLREGIMNAEKAIQEIGRHTAATMTSLLPNDIP